MSLGGFDGGIHADEGAQTSLVKGSLRPSQGFFSRAFSGLFKEFLKVKSQENISF